VRYASKKHPADVASKIKGCSNDLVGAKIHVFLHVIVVDDVVRQMHFCRI
jgi:hypothetical protein